MATAKFLKLIIFIVLSMATTGVGAADWTPLSSNSIGDAFYIDLAGIRRNGDTLQVWTMVNLGTPEPDGTRSQKTMLLLNCQTWEVAFRSGVGYSALNGGGKILNSHTLRPHAIDYQPVVPDTINEAVLKISCGTSR